MKRSVRRYPLALLLSLLLLSGFTGFTSWTHQALGFTISKSANYLRQALTQPAKPSSGHAAIVKPIQQSNDSTETTLEPAQGTLTIPQNVLPGGGGTSTGGTNTLTGTIGQGIVGASTGGNFSLSGGFWGAISGSQCPTITIAPATLPNGQLGQPYSQQLTQTGGTGTINWTFTGTLPNGITLGASTGLLSGTPLASGSSSFTVKVTDGNGCTKEQAYTLAIGCPNIAITPTSLPSGTVNTPYSQKLTATGGTPPYTFSPNTGSAPTGLTLMSDGTLAGTPTVANTFTFSVKVTDAAGCVGLSATYNLTINPVVANNSIAGTVSYCITPATKIPGVTVATNGATPITSITNAQGGYSLTGLGGGAVTVTPTKTPNSNAISSFDAALIQQQVIGLANLTDCQKSAGDSNNSGGNVSSFDAALIQQFVVGTAPAAGSVVGTWKMTPAFRSYPSVNGAVTGQDYDAVLVGDVSGNWTPPQALAEAESFDVPFQQTPISLPTTSAAPGSTITVPVSIGTSLTGLNVIAYQFTLNFNSSVLQLQNPAFDTAGTVSAANGFSVLANSPVAGRLVVSGSGPNPLSGTGTLLNLKFTVIGAAGASSALTFAPNSFLLNETVQTNVTNGNISVTGGGGGLQVPISLANSSAAPAANVTVPVTVGSSLTGLGVIAYQFTLNFDPNVLELQNPAFDTAGTVSTANGFSVLANSPVAGRLVVSGSGPNALSGTGTLLNLKLKVKGAAGTSSALTFAPGSFLLNETVQTNVTNGNISVTGGGGGLQVPISLANSSAAPAANVTIPVTLGGTLTGLNVIAYQFTLNFDPNVLELQNPAFDTAGTVSTANGFSVLANLPVAGRLVVSGSGPNALSGTGTLLNLKLKVKGAAGTSSALTFAPGSFLLNETVQTNVTNGNLSVVQTCQAITIAPATLPNGQLGQPYSQQLTQTGGTGTLNWTFTGALPNGMTLNASTGLLSGAPVASGNFNFTVKATDANGCMGTKAFTLMIGCPVITISPTMSTSLPAAVRGQAYSQTLTATGGTPNYTFSFDGTPPSGLSLSSTGALTGSGTYPAGVSSLSFVVKVTDAGGCTGTQNYTVSITAGTYTVSGRVVDQSGNGIADVSMFYRNSAGVLGGPRTDANGNWMDSSISSIPHSCAEPISVTPSKSGFTFTPLSRSFCAASSSLDFTGIPTVTTVSAASFLGNEIAPESIVAAFGVNLATKVEIASATPLPTTLAGTTVKVRDSAGTERLAPLFFVAPSQVNYQVPPGTAVGLASVTVTSGDNKISLGTINVATVAPGLFSANASGQGVAAAVLLRIRNGVQTFESVSRFDQAAGGQVPIQIDMGPAGDLVYLLAYGSGLRGRTAAGNISVDLGDVVKSLNPNDFEDVFATPGFIGLDQASILLPRTLIGKGLINLTMTVDGKTSNTVQINIK